jgi:hypothetical protein
MADEKTFSDEQTAAIKEIVGGIVNSAISARDKMADKKRAEDRDAIKSEFGKLLDEKLSTFRPTEVGGEGGEGGGKGKGGKGPDPQLVAMQRKLDDMDARERASTERAAKAEQRRRALERNSRLDAALAKGGVSDPFMRELAIAHFDRRGVAPWSSEDEDGEVVWSVEDGLPVSLDDGFGKWLKTEEAKRFLPPTGTKGSGSRPGNGRPPEAKKDPTYEDVGNYVLGLTQGTRLGE